MDFVVGLVIIGLLLMVVYAAMMDNDRDKW